MKHVNMDLPDFCEDYEHLLRPLEVEEDLARWNRGTELPRRVFKDRSNPLESLNDVEFVKRYRLTKNLTIELIDLLQEDLIRNTDRNKPVPPALQVMSALRFFAGNSFYDTVGEIAGISQGTICKIVSDVSVAIAQRKGHYMSFPQPGIECTRLQEEFFRIARFPGVIGAIDCKHVRITCPLGEHKNVYINRKGYTSLNVQAICDANMMFTNVVARWYGSAHDSRIYNESRIKHVLENQPGYTGFLLGKYVNFI
jgi:hypothetical protein